MTQVYDDDACDSSSQSSTYRVAPGDAEIQGGKQAYSMYPNPNMGTFMLLQQSPTDTPLSVKIYNALGVQVYTSGCNFTNGRMEIKMNQNTPGLYLVCIGDAKATCIRFIIK